MNSSPIRLRLSSGSLIPASFARKRSCACDVDERHAVVAVEGLDHLLGLALAQEAVVDEDAGELVADGLVHEQRRDGAVDSARERAEHPVAPDGCADPLDLLLDHGRGRPGRGDPGELVEEVLQHLLAVRGVHDLGVELDAVALARCRPRTRRSGSQGEPATTSAPAGAATTESPCDIHTVCSRREVAEEPAARSPSARSSRTRSCPCGRPGRRGRAPSAASRSRCRAWGCRARRSPCRCAASRRRRPTRRRPRGSAPPAAAPGSRPRRCGARRPPSRRAPRERGARSAARTGRRGR